LVLPWINWLLDWLKTNQKERTKVRYLLKKDLSIPQGKYISFFFLKLKGQTLNIYKKFMLALAFPLMKRQKETRLGLAYVKFHLVPHVEECSPGVIKIE
jgi:hypothetical protein